MDAENRTCQNCKTLFTIEPDDFAFYAKIAVPPPTFCPECRKQRRMVWRNERTFYRAVCAATGRHILTMFSPESKVIIYDRDYWWSDQWDQLVSGRDYDFSKPFFTQFQELLRAAPLPNLANTNVVRTEYGNHSADCKDCYLIFASFINENVFYAAGAVEDKDSMDLYNTSKASQCYENTLCDSMSKVFFAYNSDSSINAKFLNDCVNVNDSIGCVNLRSKSYCIFNKPYSKEEYKKEIAKSEYDFGSYKKLTAFKERYEAFSKKFPHRFASILRSVNSTGDMIMDAKNCKECFDVYGSVEDSKYAIHVVRQRNAYDGYGLGGNADLIYEGVDSGIEGARYIATVCVHKCHDVRYSYYCQSSSHLFGCVGLRNKQYCIFNKQYSREEYEKMVLRIIEHMNAVQYRDQRGCVYGYGEFFPQEISPFSYNETIAQEYGPITESEARAGGFIWKTLKEKDYTITLDANDISDHIKDTGDDIINQTIGCLHKGRCEHQCTNAFKIIPAELDFYRQYRLALPRLCPNCRHYSRLAQRNPFKLWDRACDCKGNSVVTKQGYVNSAKHFHGDGPCSNTFRTSYASERSETVYCEQCYQAEVS